MVSYTPPVKQILTYEYIQISAVPTFLAFVPPPLQVFAEQVQNFVGADEIVPDLQLGPMFPLFKFSSWSHISQVCGDSRVWGGMHFEVRPTQTTELPPTLAMVAFMQAHHVSALEGWSLEEEEVHTSPKTTDFRRNPKAIPDERSHGLKYSMKNIFQHKSENSDVFGLRSP